MSQMVADTLVAVLEQIGVKQANALADWVAAKGKNLTCDSQHQGA